MLSSSERAILRSMPLFENVPEAEIAELEAGITLRSHRKGETLFNWGEDATRFYGILSGWVKIYRNGSNGEQAIFGVFGRGETFGEATVIMGKAYPATAEAVSNCNLFQFEREHFDKKLGACPSLNRLILTSMTHHLHALMRQVEQLKTQSAEERLANFLLGLCAHDTRSCTIELPYDKTLIAGRLGMKPESLSRNLNRLSKWGVRVDGKKVTIETPARLRERYRKPHHDQRIYTAPSSPIGTNARLSGI